MSSADLNRAALSLAVNGFAVFPIKPREKSPPLVKFTKQASADPNEVERMWADHPEANVGVHAGGGTVIVDADTYKNPACLEGLEIPETTTDLPLVGASVEDRAGSDRVATLTLQVEAGAHVRPGRAGAEQVEVATAAR